LGEEAPDAFAGNALVWAASPHLANDLERRREFLRALAGGEAADPSQPFPERGNYDGFGAHCGVGADPTFSGWTCAEGLVCRAYDGPAGDSVGQCLPARAGFAGDACETGPLSVRTDARRDAVAKVQRAACADNAVCNLNSVGFPGGMCTESCSALSSAGACGQIAVLDPFNACLARGEAFSACITRHVRPAGLRACSEQSPCRDDYVCARGAAAGVCIPPYFLFQLRVDGHG
jgi:hypothetical protein